MKNKKSKLELTDFEDFKDEIFGKRGMEKREEYEKEFRDEIGVPKNKEEYEKMLARFEEIFQAENETKESEDANNLSILLKIYEDENFKIDK